MLNAIARRWAYRRRRRDDLAEMTAGEFSDETRLLRRIELLLIDIRRDIAIIGVAALAVMIYWTVIR